ncbi:MAG: Flp pilus assembly complex ATPase component TadA [Planctomycetales bacterium]|nr:Flp pilus assembly complex ATPase component TadA [Planctomycetales bacterium]
MSQLPNFNDLDPRRDDYATLVVQRILQAAVASEASDIHLETTARDVVLKWRVDGNLLLVAQFADGASTSILGRLKALARLITYRHDIPQEGRLAIAGKDDVEARVGILPTLHGERAVIRLAAKRTADWQLAQLGLPPDLLERLSASLRAHSGVVLITGTAGSGKTTTAYAALREILGTTSLLRSVVSLEDPIETEVAGVAQSQINPAVGYDWSAGLKALLRQDPEVMLIGEIRDAETAAVVFQAAMTGQLVLATMHARHSADALRRLMDMQVPAHHLRSALNLLLCQRLLRGVCPRCLGRGPTAEPTAASHRAAADHSPATGNSPPPCSDCMGSGLAGRVLLAELFPTLDGELSRAVLHDADSGTIARAAQSLGMRSLATLADQAVREQRVHAAEIQRHFIRDP